MADLIHVAGHLHDLGKIGVPDEILGKTSALTTKEWLAIRKHPDIGADILAPIACLRECGIVDMVRAHHERFDGSGYPQGLTGEAIPLEGRIVAIADVFDALVSVRPYKPALPLETALQYFDEQSGRHFDPTLLVAFKKALPEILGVKEIYADENGALTDLEFHIKEIYDHKDDPTGYPEILSSTEGGP